MIIAKKKKKEILELIYVLISVTVPKVQHRSGFNYVSFNYNLREICP